MIFLYEAIEQNGTTINGKIETRDREEAIEILHGHKLVIVNLFEERRSILNIKVFQKVKNKDIVVFAREVALLFEAEIPALRVFKLLSTQTSNPYFQEILVDIADQIQKGSSIADAFRKYTHIFGSFFANVLEVGEESGTLNKSFKYLADHLEKTQKTVQKVKQALTYPLFVIVTFIGVMWLMFAVVIPQMSEILRSFGQDLPAITQFIIGISDFVQVYGYALIVIIIIGSVAMYRYVGTPDGRAWLDSMKLRIPLIGGLAQKFYIAQFTGNLAVMLQSGVPLPRALNSVKNIIKNVIFRKELEKIGKEVLEGKTFSQSLETHPIVGANISQLVKVGEEAGELGKVLDTLTNFYQEEVSNDIDSMVDLIQPTVILLLGLGVGVLLGAILLPIYSLAGAI